MDVPNPASALKPESTDDFINLEKSNSRDGEDGDDEDGDDVVEVENSNLEHVVVAKQRKLFARLSGDAILKANKMVVVTIQKPPQLWSLPPSLGSLLSSLVS